MGLHYITKDLIEIQAFNIIEFCQLYQEAILKGYRYSPENAHQPWHALGCWEMKLVAADTLEGSEEGVEVQRGFQDIVDKINQTKETENAELAKEQTKQPAKRGRPKSTKTNK